MRDLGRGLESARRLLPAAAELEDLLRLALPVVVVQVGLMAMGVADSIMVGHVSAGALASVALGNLYYFGVTIFGMGVLLALDPVVSQAVGARDEPAVARGVQRGLALALVLSPPTALLLLAAGPFLRWAGQPAEVIPAAAAYCTLTIPGVLPYFAFIAFRQTLQALGRMRPIVLAIVAGNLANVALNWTLIYGHLGAPPLGVAGAAWATTASRWLLALALLALAWPELRPRLVPLRHGVLEPEPLRRMLALGLPIGLQFLLEWGIFATIAILMGRLGTIPVAAHQVAINLASLTFMVPLGISAAATVLVGRAVGRNDSRGARRAARAALACGAGFMGLTALVLLWIPAELAGIYSREAPVVALAAALLPVAGAFQVFDGLQVVSIGILRGLADTRAPFVIALLGFWLLGFPVSVGLGFYTPLGAVGLWYGLVVGLGAVAALLLARVAGRPPPPPPPSPSTLLLARVAGRLRRSVARVAIDREPRGDRPVAGAAPSAAL